MDSVTGLLLMIVGLLLWERIDKLMPKPKPKHIAPIHVGNMEVTLTANTDNFDAAIKKTMQQLDELAAKGDKLL